jgi:hypothetical protein
MQTINKRVGYLIDVPDFGTPIASGELREMVQRSGSHFFDTDTMRFFRSRLDAYVYPAPDGWYFVTSEQHVSHFANIHEPRKYTVRQLRIVDGVPNDGGPGTRDLRLVELNGFQAYPTLTRARTAAQKAARTARPLCTSCRSRVSSEDGATVCGECQERAARVAADAAAKAGV